MAIPIAIPIPIVVGPLYEQLAPEAAIDAFGHDSSGQGREDDPSWPDGIMPGTEKVPERGAEPGELIGPVGAVDVIAPALG